MDAGPRIHHLPAVHQEVCQQILSHNHGSGQFIPKWKEPHIGDTYTPIFHKKKHDCGFGIRGIALQVLVTRLYLNKWLQSLVYETTWVDFRECNTGSAGKNVRRGCGPHIVGTPKKNEWNQSTIPQRLNRKVSGGNFSRRWLWWLNFPDGKNMGCQRNTCNLCSLTPGCHAIDILSLKLTSLRTWKMDGPGIRWSFRIWDFAHVQGLCKVFVSRAGKLGKMRRQAIGLPRFSCIGNSCKSSHATLWYRSSKVTMFCFPWCNGLRNLQLQ